MEIGALITVIVLVAVFVFLFVFSIVLEILRKPVVEAETEKSSIGGTVGRKRKAA